MDLALMLTVPLVAGAVAMAVRLPPMIGFLVAGFVLHGVGVTHFDGLDVLADVGVTLLLFGIGLKLDPRSLVRREVAVTTVLHLAVLTAVGVTLLSAGGLLGVDLLADLDWRGATLLALALSFSSTVFVVKVLDVANSSRAFYGRTAIGILVVQDVVAVAALSVISGEPPSPWALTLVLLLPGAWLARAVLDRLDHGELVVLFAVTAALVPGYLLFEEVGLKGDLGALVIGALLASHPRAPELRDLIFGVKELLLIAFFVSLGFMGLPTAEHLVIALALVTVLIPIKVVLYVVVLHRFGLRSRSATLVGVSLASFSEFGLILADRGVSADVVDSDWLSVLSTTVAVSFVVSAGMNAGRERWVSWAGRRLPGRLPEDLLGHDRPIDLGHAQAVVLGMGRVGRSAYERLVDEHGLVVVGVESDSEVVADLTAQDLRVVEADATDPEFWIRLNREHRLDIAVLAMPAHGANRAALEQLRRSGFAGTVAVVAQYGDEVDRVRRLGADVVLHLYDGAGSTLADMAAETALRDRDDP